MTADRDGMPRDDHETLDELAVGWALHALEPEDEAVFALHLADCGRCAATVAETTELMGAMARDLPVAEPSDDLRSRLRAAVATTDQLPAPASPIADDGGLRPQPVPRSVQPPASRPRWRRALAPALVAAAFATIVGLGLWNVFLSSSQERLQETVASQEQMMDALLSPDRTTVAPVGTDGRPVATVVPRGEELQLVSHGLSVNDAATTTYVVWGLDGDETEPLGTFDVRQSQMELLTVGSRLTGLDRFTSYAISLEPGQAAPSEPTDVVATGEVGS